MLEPDPDEERVRCLGQDLAAGVIDRRSFRLHLAAMLQRRFDCPHVELWRVSGAPTNALVRVTAPDSDGTTLPASAIADYLAHLSHHGVFVAQAGALPGLVLQARRLHRSACDSVLHAAVRLNGRLLGVLACGRTNPPGPWSAADLAAIKRLAACVAVYNGRVGLPD